jgi:hypothetical protein
MAQPFVINPAFHRRPHEAAIVGRIVVAFGELELTICNIAGEALNMRFSVLRTLYRIRITSGRVDAAYNLVAPLYAAVGLGEKWSATFGMITRCLQIRNQYAHCHWADHEVAGLFFADLQEAATRSAGFDYHWRHVDGPLLAKQEAFFACTLEWLRFLDHEMAVKQGRLKFHIWPEPPTLDRPPLHNPPERHVPPWLSEDQKALHKARTQAAQGGAPTPTPAQQALDNARNKKRAHRVSLREKSTKKHSGQ